MALPATVTKASGLSAALRDLDILPRETIGVGDAENDQAFLRMCGLSVAVANALPAVKEMADVTTAGVDGIGVTELIHDFLCGRLDDLSPRKHDQAPHGRPL
jgi:hydroxymethylpyrimidine pyrophosphatase-like HAD family hydrolase